MGHKTQFLGHTEQVLGQSTLGHSRARTPLRGTERVSQCPIGTGTGTETLGIGTTVAAGQGQSSAPLRDRPNPTDTTVADRKQEHKDRFAADPRFSAWVAMGPA